MIAAERSTHAGKILRTTRVALIVVLLLLSSLGFSQNDQRREPQKFFREYIGLNEEQIEAIHRGQALAKILDSRTPDEVFVFGAVYIHSAPESYIRLAGNVAALRKLPSYLAIRKFSDPPQLADLNGFTLEGDDIKQLQKCKSGKCELQLPGQSMEEFQRSVNWSAPDTAEQVDRVAQKMALEVLLRYTQGGTAALGIYQDKSRPTDVGKTFNSLLSRSKALPAYLPDLDRYLLDYPNVKLANVETEFYWEKVNFGLKPTLRIVQGIVYRGSNSAQAPYAVAVKQLYSSHYFQTALDLSVCVRDPNFPNQRGFYLITLKGSQQAGLTGLKGGIVRKVAVDKTRSSLERALAVIKQRLEATTE